MLVRILEHCYHPIMYYCNEWPKMPDGNDFDGKHRLSLVHSGNSPFQGLWDVNLLIQEVEENLNTQVIEIPVISIGSDNYVSSTLKFS